nr:TRAP transporter substrate-binding protein DctP [Fredinandcohnia onubensis]
MRKNILSFTMVITMIVFITGCVEKSPSANSDAGQGEDVIKLRLNSAVPNTSSVSYTFTIPWMERVEKETNGKVQFEAFYGGELVPPGEEIRALQDGTIDIASPFLAPYSISQFPLSDVTLLPLQKTDPLIAGKAYVDLITSDVPLKDGKKYSELLFEEVNMKVLPMHPTPDHIIGTANHDFNTVESFQNLTLRASNQVYEMFVKELGSSPVSMPFTEAIEALSKGTVDGEAGRTLADFKGLGLEKVLTNVLTGYTMGHFPFSWIMSEEKWNELPEDVRKVMEEAAMELSYSEENKTVLDEGTAHVKKQGVKFTDFSELDTAAQEYLVQTSENTWKEWIETKEKAGLPGLEVAKLWRDLVIKHGGEVHEPILEIE